MSISNIRNRIVRRTVLVLLIVPLTLALVFFDVLASIADAYEASRDAWAGRT